MATQLIQPWRSRLMMSLPKTKVFFSIHSFVYSLLTPEDPNSTKKHKAEAHKVGVIEACKAAAHKKVPNTEEVYDFIVTKANQAETRKTDKVLTRKDPKGDKWSVEQTKNFISSLPEFEVCGVNLCLHSKFDLHICVLQKYAQKFEEEEINGEALLTLTEKDLEKFEMKLGARRTLLAIIEDFKSLEKV